MDSWEKFLDPEKLRGSLLAASLYIAAYETCRESILDKLKSFYFDYIDENGPHPGPAYQSEVLSKAKSPVEATLKWFLEMKAIEEPDIAAFSKARKLRNQIAHDMPKYITEPDHQIDQAVFEGLLEVTRKIGVWWVVNVEIATDPDYDETEVDEEEIQIGTIIMIQLMMDIAYGNEPEEGFYYREFVKARAHKKPEFGVR
tara:strand:+ start:1281 stop:1880 length:600 start_codon:yes stop_codon:yes gene_type:complete